MSDRAVTIATYPFAAEAHFFRDQLEAEGIKAFVADENVVTNDWFLGNAVGYIKLQVREADAEAAHAVLARSRKEAGRWSTPEDEAGSEALACLECGQPIPEDEPKCPACGWSYSGVEES